MKTASFFYRYFSEFPQAFFALIGEDEQKSQHYKFTSVEVKEQGFRFDGVFQPATSDDHLYFTEVQFRKDDELYSGLFAEICLYLRQYRPVNDWRAVVFFPNESFDPGVHRHYREFFESGRLKRVNLNKLPKEYRERFPLSILQIIMESDQELLGVIDKIVKRVPVEIHDQKGQEKIIDLLVNLLMHRLPNLTRKEIEKMFDTILSDIKKSRAYQEIAQEAAQEAAYKSKRGIALAMAKERMSPALISKLTGLSKAEVLEISKEVAARPKPRKSRKSKNNSIKSATR